MRIDIHASIGHYPFRQVRGNDCRGLLAEMDRYDISKAMVTTASGLIVAIPALMAYSYFRGQVQQVTNAIEIYSADIIKAIHHR